ncbi:MAG: sodium ion-translocating decarboxylase subunit beta [Nitrospirota bacterium]|nr:sodium ion-translocating decarboxylase subunit beta [Nitrospirota bacterium]
MGIMNMTPGAALMMGVGGLLIFLAIRKGYEPLLLVPIGLGAILTNIPLAGIAEPDGIIGILYELGIHSGLFPLLIFMGIGALTDFGPLIANPKLALLGGAAQLGIFGTLVGALMVGDIPGLGLDFTLREAAAIAIIGGADGPTSIYVAGALADHLLGAIAVAAYSYMALVPIIQPPIIRALTTPKERVIVMSQVRHVTQREKILFAFAVLFLCIIIVPSATPLVGMLVVGNVFRESGVVERLFKTSSNELLNIVTIFLGLSVGSKLAASEFLTVQTLGISVLGLAAFCVGTAGGLLMGKLMCWMSGGKINPMIGAAGVSAVPMAARVVQKIGMEYNPNNHLLFHAMGPNVAGVLGSAIAAGVLISFLG